jgi:UDP-galactopyranose mutase
MTMSEKQVVEVNGIKMEVDMRYAKVIENYKIGDAVKVLIKKYNDYTSYPGVIVGFDNFEKLPTIIICYVDVDYNAAEVKFAYFNEKSEDIEIAPYHNPDFKSDKHDVVDKLNRDIEKKEAELDDIKAKKVYFMRHFDKYFDEVQGGDSQ